MHFSRFAQSVAALLLLTIGFTASAHAQNNKPIRSGDYYEDRASMVNSSPHAGILAFAQTPTDKYLNITNIHCRVQTSAPEIIQGFFLRLGTNSGNLDLNRNLEIKGGVPQSEPATDNSKQYSAVLNQMFYKVGPGRFPSIQIDTFSSNGIYSEVADCVIVGNLTDN